MHADPAIFDYVSVPSPGQVRCANRACRRVLNVDTGLTLEGLPGGWATCHAARGGCGQTTCAAGLHLLPKGHDLEWEDGRTRHGSRVPSCTQDRCGVAHQQRVDALCEFMARPRGVAAHEAVAAMRRRAVIGSGWLTICAQVMVEVHRFYTVTMKEIAAQRRAEFFAREQAIWDAERRAAAAAYTGPQVVASQQSLDDFLAESEKDTSPAPAPRAAQPAVVAVRAERRTPGLLEAPAGMTAGQQPDPVQVWAEHIRV